MRNDEPRVYNDWRTVHDADGVVGRVVLGSFMFRPTGEKHRVAVLARVVLGSFMFSRGKELEHWDRMTSHANDQIVQWHSLL